MSVYLVLYISSPCCIYQFTQFVCQFTQFCLSVHTFLFASLLNFICQFTQFYLSVHQFAFVSSPSFICYFTQFFSVSSPSFKCHVTQCYLSVHSVLSVSSSIFICQAYYIVTLFYLSDLVSVCLSLSQLISISMWTTVVGSHLLRNIRGSWKLSILSWTSHLDHVECMCVVYQW